MDDNNTLFITKDLSVFLNQQFLNIYNNIDDSIKKEKSLADIQNELKKFNNYILNLEYDLSYEPTLRKKSFGEWPNKRTFHIIGQRFKFTGNANLFYLQPNNFNLYPPIGLIDKYYLYFEVHLPYQNDQSNLASLALKEMASYKTSIEFYILSQKEDIKIY